MSRLFWTIAALIGLNGFAFGADAPPASTGAPLEIDFLRDIYPIFKRSCLLCHGEEVAEGSLRLDRYEYAARGGQTSSPVLSGDPATNAVLLRVTTDDDSIRMPKGARPLPEKEQAVIRRWVELGAPWTDPPEVPAAPVKPHYEVTWESLQPWDPREWSHVRTTRVLWWFWRFGSIWLILLLWIGVCDRARYWVPTGSPRVVPPRGWFWRKLAAVPRSWHLVAMLSLAGVMLAVFLQQQGRLADSDLARLKTELSDLARRVNPELPTTTEGAPRPVHPRHPPRLGGEYYRGNDERNEALFNGGFYRTCIMRVWLCRADDAILEWGDEIDPAETYVRIEIEQSPGATNALFASELMRASYISRVVPGEEVTDRDTEVACFEPDGERRWTARLKLDLADAEHSRLQGLLYVCRGEEVPDTGSTVGSAHYAAEYSIRMRDHRISADSVLWMGYIYRTAGVLPTPPGKIAEDEWFSFRPIPEIEGEQTTDDPKLLGIDDYRDVLSPRSDEDGNKQPDVDCGPAP
ncbi:MAG: hypothetical protein KDA75_07605 [Planctomycetaceae bacterium]|nr:hypothetical protein [Planctomycetaceae bacterium]